MAHASLPPSAAARWLACPGSIQAAQGMPDESSPFAREGTAAHELAAWANEANADPSRYEGQVISVPYTDEYGVDVAEDYIVDLDMIRNVRTYTAYCTHLKARNRKGQDKVQWWTEQRYSLAGFEKPLGDVLWGTADFVAYDPEDKTLYVVDLKYGRGVRVFAAQNTQLMVYALLVWSSMQLDVHRIQTVIVQPRIGNGRPDEAVLTPTELLEFGMEVVNGAYKALEPGAGRVAGEHCRFCPARFICPEYANMSTAIATTDAQEDFSMEGTPQDIKTAEMPPVETLSTNEIAARLQAAEQLEQWIKDARKYLYEQATKGEDVPGYKLVNKRPKRVWAESEDKVTKTLRPQVAKKADMYKKELLSPAQMEKVVEDKTTVSELVASVSSGTTLVPESDPREAVAQTAIEEFDSSETQSTPSLEDLL